MGKWLIVRTACQQNFVVIVLNYLNQEMTTNLMEGRPPVGEEQNKS